MNILPTDEKLTQHVEAIHHKTFSCTLCDKVFYFNTDLKQHINADDRKLNLCPALCVINHFHIIQI